jgi:hypothetical protein
VRLTSVERLPLGARVGRAICHADGTPLVQAGQTVDAGALNALRAAGISRIYTADPVTDDIEIASVVSPSTLLEAHAAVAEAFAGHPSQRRLRDVCRELVAEVQAAREVVHGAVPIYPLRDAVVAHGVHSTIHALLIASETHVDASLMRGLAMGMLFHDIGLMADRGRTQSPGKLSDMDMEAARHHAREGFDMLRDVLEFSPLGRSIALSHHERTDGSGYPRGLKGDSLPDSARIAATADVFTALISDRPHRPAWLNDQAFSYLLHEAADQFDPVTTGALAARVEIYPPGAWVGLRDGRAGIVLGSRRGGTVRPFVRVLRDADRQPLAAPMTVDLLAEPGLYIADVFYA